MGRLSYSMNGPGPHKNNFTEYVPRFIRSKTQSDMKTAEWDFEGFVPPMAGRTDRGGFQVPLEGTVP